VPELPEVTVISEDVRTLAKGKKVVRAEIFRDDVSNVGVEEFPRKLVGRTLEGTGRRGKITTLDFGDVVGVVHLVISGRVLRLPEWRELDKMHTAVVEFEGGLVLAFTRLWLGYFDLYDPERVGEHPLISRLGPDPFSRDFSPEYLSGIFNRKAAIKGLLLDQSVVAGLGNIYVDEVLCAARPSTPTTTLSGRRASTNTSSRSSPARASHAPYVERRSRSYASPAAAPTSVRTVSVFSSQFSTVNSSF
jgi:formamidopyrimidine-DNA glycosylase